ncbi:MAG: chemotaxis family two-component system response regulator Rcp1 [Rhodothermales bacterium]|jgi:chemotaxis family two-component system response regulator Rcp1
MLDRPIEILQVEDNPGDVELTREALDDAGLAYRLHVATDGQQALSFLRREGICASAPRPDIILLDLNLPRMDGRETLAAIKQDDNFRRIPVIVLTTSDAESDIRASYNLHANCFITKPVDLDDFLEVVRAIQSFWLGVAKIPTL